jgi:hypothetical protein
MDLESQSETQQVNGREGNGGVPKWQLVAASDVVKKWQLTVATIGLLITVGSSFIHSIVSNAQMEQRITEMERHIEYDDANLARKDVIDMRLLNIESTQQEIRSMQREQTVELQRILAREK